MTFTAEEKAAAARREAKMRHRVYPGWVQRRKMSQGQADREIAIMDEIAEDYGRLAEVNRLL